MSSRLYIDHLSSLAWLALIPAAWWLARRSLIDLPAWQQRVAAVLRSLLIALLAFTLAEPRWKTEDDRQFIVVAIDRSASVSPEALQKGLEWFKDLYRQRGKHEVRLLYFDREAEKAPLESLADLEALEARPATHPGSNLANAMALARSLYPQGYIPRFVLLSDGLETEGNLLREVNASGSTTIPVDVLPYEANRRLEVAITDLKLPQSISPGQTFSPRATLYSSASGRAEVRLFFNGFLVEKRELEISPGEPRIEFRPMDPAAAGGNQPSGRHEFAVQVSMTEDTRPENNRMARSVTLHGEPAILYLEGEVSEGRYLAEVLEQKNFEVDLRDAYGCPSKLSALDRFDMVIFSDVPAARLNEAQMKALEIYVKELGGGFLMIGGEHSFGLGGYSETPVEEILPVRMEPQQKEETPSVGMVLVIDRSGSMEGMKIQLAKEAAIAAAEELGPKDQISVIAFDSSFYWILRTSSASEKEKIRSAIATIQAGGGTNIYPGLQAAWAELRDSPVRKKHAIVLTDGHSEGSPAQYQSLCSRMYDDRITVSTVGVTGADEGLLKSMAGWGHGRYYAAVNPSELPKIFARETRAVAQSSIVDEPFQPAVVKDAECLHGIDFPASPFLFKYISTRLKPSAEQLLVSDYGEPILARWNVGLGKVAAFTSGANTKWASEWIGWPGYGKFWSQLVRDTARTPRQATAQIEARLTGQTAEIQVDLIDRAGEFRNHAEVRLGVTHPSGKTEEVLMEQTNAGRYQATHELEEDGPYLFNLREKEEVLGSLSLTRPYPREYLPESPNDALLRRVAELTSGKFRPEAADLLQPPARQVMRKQPLFNYLLPALLAVFLTDLLLRRVSLDLFRRFRPENPEKMPYSKGVTI